MGSLTPGATYIYERDGNTVYAREIGKTDRTVIGYSYEGEAKLKDVQREDTFLGQPMSEIMLMAAILEESKTNSALREEVERVKILYHLGKKDGGQTRT